MTLTRWHDTSYGRVQEDYCGVKDGRRFRYRPMGKKSGRDSFIVMAQRRESYFLSPPSFQDFSKRVPIRLHNSSKFPVVVIAWQ